MPELIIRKADKKDLPEIQKLLSTYFLDMEGLECEDFLLAEKEARVVGGAAMISNNYKGVEFLELHSIAVHPNRRGKGIGARLVEALLSNLPPDRKLYVRTTSPRFFEKMGFGKLPAAVKSGLWEDCANCEHFKNCGQTILRYKGGN
ncbi:MAG: GNAT family N-acetyltransferase [Methanosarcinaceae archaeon]|nr:GNAT family N-acetyltransferase [Methanosarcinaceae archaeon]